MAKISKVASTGATTNYESSFGGRQNCKVCGKEIPINSRVWLTYDRLAEGIGREFHCTLEHAHEYSKREEFLVEIRGPQEAVDQIGNDFVCLIVHMDKAGYEILAFKTWYCGLGIADRPRVRVYGTIPDHEPSSIPCRGRFWNKPVWEYPESGLFHIDISTNEYGSASIWYSGKIEPSGAYEFTFPIKENAQ